MQLVWRARPGGRQGLTLGEDEVILLDEALERVLVELLDIGRSSNSREEGGADGRVLHPARREEAILWLRGSVGWGPLRAVGR